MAVRSSCSSRSCSARKWSEECTTLSRYATNPRPLFPSLTWPDRLGLAMRDYAIPWLRSRGSIGLGNTSFAICERTVCSELSFLHMVPTSAQTSQGAIRWSSKSQLLSHQGQDAILHLVDRSSMPLSLAPCHLQISFQTAAFLRLVQRSSIQLRKWSGSGPGMRLMASLTNTVECCGP